MSHPKKIPTGMYRLSITTGRINHSATAWATRKLPAGLRTGMSNNTRPRGKSVLMAYLFPKIKRTWWIDMLIIKSKMLQVILFTNVMIGWRRSSCTYGYYNRTYLN